MPRGYKPKGMDRVILAIYEAFKRKKAKPLSTVRSKALSKRLSDAGISQKKIDQMKRGYKTK